MIIRIVKLTFQEEKIQDFLSFFEEIKHQVNTFDGCLGMKLLQDVNTPSVVMTYSHWDNGDSLERYRKSELFGKVWPTIKPWFSEKAEAWSVKEYFNGFEK